MLKPEKFDVETIELSGITAYNNLKWKKQCFVLIKM